MKMEITEIPQVKALTIILSLSIMVLSLCVMVTTVHWANFSWIASLINSSVLESKSSSLVSKDRKSRLKTKISYIIMMFLKLNAFMTLLFSEKLSIRSLLINLPFFIKQWEIVFP